MTSSEGTFKQLKLLAGTSVPTEINLKRLFATSFDEVVDLIEAAIDHISQDLSQSAHHRQKDKEDRTTIDVVSALSNMGFLATHDTDMGGHCDVVIREKNNFVWAGEAKKHGSYAWAMGGFNQLDTRYSTGMPGQTDAGILIYCYAADAKSVLGNWRDFLAAERSDLQISDCTRSPLAFISRHKHPRSGLPFRIRHVIIPLYWDPKK